ncbi:MAG: thiamine pyrophosphate-binding protein [Rhodospirillales bacterium]|nr:thiamine pyrophosphate-binding protein [Rhodospirillales bacterium]
MPEPTGHRKLLEQLRADGVEYMFGNPGSSEEGLLDEVARFPDLTYVLGLQEAALVCIADGYAQATHRPAVVQLHCSVGLGNAIGSLFHARQRRTPLLVIAGEAGIAAGPLEAHMSADLVAMARPVTKYAARAEHPGSLLRLLRRCYKVAATPPFGPVFLSVPQDILDAPNFEPVVPTPVPSTRVLPEPALVSAAAEMLRTAERPVIIMGDGVAHSGGAAELARLAETLGAGVYGAMAAEVNIGWDHPLYCGLTGHMFGRDSARTVADADAALICGTYVFPDVFPMPENPFAEGAKVIHVDLDAYAIGKNHPVTLGLVSDPKLTLGALADAVAAGASEPDRQKAAARARQLGEANRDRLARGRSSDEAQAFPELLRWVVPRAPGSFFQSPGGTLGVAIPGAIGVKMAHPDRTVVGLTGDGGAMYTYQALWTAAHLGIGAKFVVCNNTSYRLLKFNLVDYWRERGLQPGEYPAEFPPPFDVHRPAVDFVTLARGLSVPAVRAETPEQIGPAIGQMLAADGPFLIELILEREVPRGAA